MFDGLRTLAIAPRNAFDDDAVSGTSDSSHLVQEEDGNVPEGYELESARGSSGVVSRTFLAAFGASCLTVFARKNLHVDVLCFASFFMERNFAEVEGLVICNRIEYSFYKHLAFDAKENVVIRDNILTAKNRDAFTNLPILHGREPKMKHTDQFLTRSNL